MAEAIRDLSQAMPTPWLALGLALAGGAFMAMEVEPVFRVAGFAAAAAGTVLLWRQGRRHRDRMARLLDAIPLEERGEGLYRALPKAWAALEQDNLTLRTQVAADDQVRRQILTHLRAGVVLVGEDGRIRLINPAAQTMLGWSAQLGPGEAAVAAFREPESLRSLQEAFAGTPVEWILKRNPRTLALRAIPFAAPGGGAPWVLVALDDLTRQEALETTRQKFIANASHELKTPVTSIRIAVENLQDGELVLAEGEVNLKAILRAVERMAMLLDEISELSRIETGALRLEPKELRVGPFAAELLEAGRAPGARLTLDLPPELAGRVFRADPLRLSQLLENLLNNAVKFSPPGSEVTLAVRAEGPWLVWAVTDHGPGLAESEAKRIFERFYRAPATRGVPGTGLGLAIVKHLAVLMEGEVEVRTAPGQGSTFTFRLPAAEREA